MDSYQYRQTGPVNCDIDFDPTPLKGKTAIVTGGANGIGEAYVRALVEAGLHVCIGDIDVARGRKLEEEFQSIKFIKCDTTVWEDQVGLFRSAKSFAPDGRISYVVANSGIVKQDEVFSVSIDSDEAPKKPDLKVVEVNVNGVLYTVKLSQHYFVRQNGSSPSPAQTDACLILISSGAGFLDVPRGPQYAATKWAMRGIMHGMRRTAFYSGSRVNVISPCFKQVRQNQHPVQRAIQPRRPIRCRIRRRQRRRPMSPAHPQRSSRQRSFVLHRAEEVGAAGLYRLGSGGSGR